MGWERKKEKRRQKRSQLRVERAETAKAGTSGNRNKRTHMRKRKNRIERERERERKMTSLEKHPKRECGGEVSFIEMDCFNRKRQLQAIPNEVKFGWNTKLRVTLISLKFNFIPSHTATNEQTKWLTAGVTHCSPFTVHCSLLIPSLAAAQCSWWWNKLPK